LSRLRPRDSPTRGCSGSYPALGDPPQHRAFYVKDDPEFDKVGNIAALLRFRSEQNSSIRSIAQPPPNPSRSRREGLVGRYRGVASG